MQVAVAKSKRNRILVTIQSLSPEASREALCNRRERAEAKTKAATARRAAREAKGAKGKVSKHLLSFE